MVSLNLRTKLMFDVCIIGHITKDIIRVNEVEREIPGGTAYYTSIALKSLGLNVAVITKVAREDQDYLLNDLERSGIAVFCNKSDKTTTFENIYFEENLDFRVQKVKAIASPFFPKDIEQISASVFHVGPLTNREVSPELLKQLTLRGKVVSLDVQGLLRKVKNGEVRVSDWEEKQKGLTYIDILKANEQEARILSGEYDMEKAASRLSGFGPKEVIITLASKGSLIFSNERFYKIPSFPPRKIIDPTGCGDTYVAGYIYQRLKSHNLNKVGIFAAAMATLKLENFGPFRGSEKDIKIITSNVG